jgi:hypothetical protein
MKKTALLNFLLLFSYNAIYSQVNCTVGVADKITSTRNSSINLGPNGTIIRIDKNFNAGYKYTLDKSNPKPLIFTGGVWMGGLDANENLKFAGSSYVQDSNEDFDWYPGPLDETGQTNELICKMFDRIFSVSKIDILNFHSIIYNSNGTINKNACDEIPISIKQWPAKGNPFWSTYFEYPLFDEELASFFDANEDGSYNPCDGDFPILESELCAANIEVLQRLPDNLHFWVVNDNGGPHRLSNGDAIQMELHNYMFNFKDEDLNDMTFYKFKAINKADGDINDFFMSLWIDADLGCNSDDYIGTNSQQNMMFVYNADATDGDDEGKCLGGINTFQNEIPMIGISYLKGFTSYKIINQNSFEVFDTGLTSSIVTNRCDAGETFDPATCDPYYRDEPFYNILKGNWVTGEPMTKYGYGYNPGSIDTAKYIYDGNPSEPNDWTMCSQNTVMGDRRFNMNTGGVKIQPGGSNEAVVAITLNTQNKNSCPDVKGLVEKNLVAKKLMENCWATISGPSAPNIISSSSKNQIFLKYSNDYPTSNNKNLSYSENLVDLNENMLYKFEGYKIYQVPTYDFDVDYLGQNGSVLIYNTDLNNDIGAISNWKRRLDVDGNLSWLKELKVEGNNSNNFESLVIDRDFILDEPL